MLIFVKKSLTVFNLQGGNEYMVEMVMFNVQSTITPIVGKPVLWFMCSAGCVIVFYICVKFGENISDDISYGADMNDGSADGRMDTQNFGWYNIIPSLLFEAGHKYAINSIFNSVSFKSNAV